MKNIQEEKGITLIALIITIIVMLILVAVTINVALNGGLFETANNASNRMEEQTIYETIVASMELKNNGDIDVKTTYQNAENALIANGEIVSPASSTIDQDASSAVMIVTGSRGTYKYTIKKEKIIIGEEIEEGEKNAVEVAIEFEEQEYPATFTYTNYKSAWFIYFDLFDIIFPAIKDQNGKITVLSGANIVLDTDSATPTVTMDDAVYYGTLVQSDYFENYNPTYYKYKKEGDEDTEYTIYNGYYINEAGDDLIDIKITPNGNDKYNGTFARESLIGVEHSDGGTFNDDNSNFYSRFTGCSWSTDIKRLDHIGKTIILTNQDDTQETYTLIEFN